MELWSGDQREDVLSLVVFVLQTYTRLYGGYEAAQDIVRAFEVRMATRPGFHLAGRRPRVSIAGDSRPAPVVNAVPLEGGD